MVVVQEYLAAWMLTGLSLALLLVATTLNALFAFSLDKSIPAFQLLAFLALATNILAICSLGFVILHYVPGLKRNSVVLSPGLALCRLSIPFSVVLVATLLNFVTLVWMAVKTTDLPERVVGQNSKSVLVAWFALWGFCTVLQVCAYAFIACWTKRALSKLRPAAVDLDPQARSFVLDQGSRWRQDRSSSFRSQDLTLTPSAPQTPTSIKVSNMLGITQSSGGKAALSSSRTRLVHPISLASDSARSSVDNPRRESVSVDPTRDSWDASDVRRDLRTTLQLTQPATRLGLETIPGSRPASPAKALDGPFLPDSPQPSSADEIPEEQTTDLQYSPEANTIVSSHSPQDLSRPTSTQSNPAAEVSGLGIASAELPSDSSIHPLFRVSSPQPAPRAMAGTTVTASPLAGQSITPTALTRIMSSTSSLVQPSTSPRSSQLDPEEPDSTPNSPGPGSPGPSIIEDDDDYDDDADNASPALPIIPDFILSAGARSSLVDYGKRKSVKGRSTPYPLAET
jgi:hypothetical protein